MDRRELPDVLRRAGLHVVTHDGWETRTTRLAAFEPQSVTWHHDASAIGDSPGVPQYMIRNYQSAGAQLWVARGGTWHVISCNKANHAGRTLAGKPGNSASFGIETDHTTGESWPGVQLESLRRGTVALLRWLGRSADDLHFHRTICDPPGRKIDPDGLDLMTERAALRQAWDGPTGPLVVAQVTPQAQPCATLSETDRDWVREWQRIIGADPDGIWGPLTDRHVEAIAEADAGRYPHGVAFAQRAVGSTPDGIPGPRTRAASNEAVRAMQRHLGVADDGDFGPLTLKAAENRRAAYWLK